MDSGPVAVGVSLPFAMQSQEGPCEGVVTVHSASWTTGPPQMGSFDNGAGLIIDIAQESTSGTVPVSPSYWQARDVQGHVYTTAQNAYGVRADNGGASKPELAFGSLTAGGRSRGFIVIDAPRGALTIELNAVGYTRVVTSWTVPAA